MTTRLWLNLLWPVLMAVCLPSLMNGQANQTKTSPALSGLKNLSEEQRKTVFWEYAVVGNRVRKEADRLYPPKGPYNAENHRARRQLTDKLYNKYSRTLRERYKLSDINLLQIEIEGTKKRWPQPR